MAGKDEGGRTAVVTGASSGIGKAFSYKLADMGYNLIIIARREGKLEEVAGEIREKGVEVDVLKADLSTEEGISRLEEKIRGIDSIRFLVNNAGSGMRMEFVDTDISNMQDMIMLHTVAPTRLCHAALPRMKEMGEGVIINVASIVGLLPSKGMSVYCGVKSYLDTFTQVLYRELKGTGVKVQSLCPGLVSSEFHKKGDYADMDLSHIEADRWMSPREVVEYSIKSLDGHRVTIVMGTSNKKRLFIRRYVREILKREIL